MTTLRSLIEQRIRTQTTCFKEVAGAANMKAILAGRVEAPGCYVFREKRAADKNKMINAVVQKMELTIAVVVISRNVAGERGSDSSDENEEMCLEVETALLGHVFDDYTAIESVGGALVSFENNLLIWRDAYRTSHHIRSI